MELNLVGVQNFKFQADDGGEIDGVKIYFLEEMEPSKDNYGLKPAEKFIKRIVMDAIGINISHLADCVNKTIFLVFNSKGKIVDVKLPAAKKA
jgi:hypothetical protein